jgi:hypothetical protein
VKGSTVMHKSIAKLLGTIIPTTIKGYFGRNSSRIAPAIGAAADLTPKEQEFLKILRPMSLDWVTTRGEFEKLSGVRQFHEFMQIVELPPTTIFTREPLTFHFIHEPRLSDLPPEYLEAYFDSHKDARKNFIDAERQLCSILGEGNRKDTSGSLQRSWGFGVFEVTLRAWPSEIKPHYLKDSSATYYRFPQLLEAATISIGSEIANVFPYHNLQWIIGVQNGTEAPADRSTLRLPSHYEPFGLRFDLRRTRRNPLSMQEALENGAVIAWKTNTPGEIGVTYKKCSVLFDMKPGGGLILLRIRPARGPGGAELTIEEAAIVDPKLAWGNRQVILCHDDQTGLDALAHQLASFWNLKLRFEESDAD